LGYDERFDDMLSRSWLLAADAAPNSPFPTMMLFTVMGVFFLYIFIVQRPAMKKEQESRQNMLRNLKKNDRVLTTGGMYGVVTNVQADSDEVTLRVDEATGAKIKVLPSAIQRVIGDDAGGKDNPKESK
jgi:preprotein translocase subunit YajC